MLVLSDFVGGQHPAHKGLLQREELPYHAGLGSENTEGRETEREREGRREGGKEGEGRRDPS